MFNVLAVRGEALPRLQRQMAEHGEGSDMARYLQERIQAEVTKVKQGQRENALRKHNILPIVFAMLTAMGKTGALGKLSSTGSEADGSAGGGARQEEKHRSATGRLPDEARAQCASAHAALAAWRDVDAVGRLERMHSTYSV